MLYSISLTLLKDFYIYNIYCYKYIKYASHINTYMFIKRCICIYTCMGAQSLQLCPTLCNPMDCSSPGSSVHGILQASILEWIAVPSSRGSSQHRDRTLVSYASCKERWEAGSLLLTLSRKPSTHIMVTQIHHCYWKT